MKGKKLLCLASAIFSLTTIAYADASLPVGGYAELNLGKSKLSGDNYSGSTKTSAIAGSINLGYKFMPYLAAELGYSRYANTKFTSGSTTAGESKNYAVNFAGKVIWPIEATGFELFAKLGLNWLSSKITVSNPAAATAIGLSSQKRTVTGPYMGIGGQYNFLPQSAIVLQWARATGNRTTGTLDLYSIGFSYIFW